MDGTEKRRCGDILDGALALLDEVPGGQDHLTVRAEANALVYEVFRNRTGMLETLHKGEYCEKFIHNSSLSRITDSEMKALMIECCIRMEEMLILRKENPDVYRAKVIMTSLMFCSEWEQEPSVVKEIKRAPCSQESKGTTNGI